MVWIAKKKKPVAYKDGEVVQFKRFCLFPRTTEEGVVVWLDSVILERTWFVTLNGRRGWWSYNGDRILATDRQKATVGLKW